MSRILTDAQKAAKAAYDKRRREALKALGVNPRHVSEKFFVNETREEWKDRQKVAEACATPFRDANAHVRGGSFKHAAVEHDGFSHSSVDAITGDVVRYRGTGFYAGRR